VGKKMDTPPTVVKTVYYNLIKSLLASSMLCNNFVEGTDLFEVFVASKY